MFIVTGYDYDDNILTLDEYLLLYQDKKKQKHFCTILNVWSNLAYKSIKYKGTS